MYTSGNPTLSNVTFGGNSSGNFGGGMFSEGGSPTLTNVIFTGNSAVQGGGMYNLFSSPLLTDVTFITNTADYGGGMHNHGGDPTLINVTLTGNSARLDGGGMLNAGSDPTLTNATFSGNTANYGNGGGMHTHEGNLTLTNVTFSGNNAHRGGGMSNSSSDPTVANCILWGNTADITGTEIYNDSSTPTVVYSLVQGEVYTGTGNIDADPRFVRDPNPGDGDWTTLGDNDYGDLHLLPDSPAIDAGDNTAVPSGVTSDLDGNLRFFDVASAADTGSGTPPIVDMGAYEATYAVDLAIVKNAVPTLAAPGQAITYTLAFSNAGSLTATGVAITDSVPVSVTSTSVFSSGVAFTQTSPGYVWAVQDLAPGQHGDITITGILSDPLPSGTFTNTAVIACAEAESDQGNNSDSASITLAPEITVNPLNLAFGNQLVDAGPTASQTVVITNDGTTALSFTGALTLTGADAGEFVLESDTGENPLTPGGTRTIQISFDPSSFGQKSANLAIRSDDDDELIVDVALSGTGTMGNDVYLPLVIRNSQSGA
jgi:uncharacterized repeat protein (TIGR01451 family)